MKFSAIWCIFQKSTGCAVYTMLQHYMWLVVFIWMAVEGLQMYLSLVQVFGSHISKYMIKFNLAAWGRLPNEKCDQISCRYIRLTTLSLYLWNALSCAIIDVFNQWFLHSVSSQFLKESLYPVMYRSTIWLLTISGIPLPIPLIGYFVFTRNYTVGGNTFTDHGYLADTMCFIRPESDPFYILFLLPILLVILINTVLFVRITRVIKNLKSSDNISDQQQILVGLFLRLYVLY
jgi:hypothetical protein